MSRRPIYSLIPNIATICALCLGISAVRYALDCKFVIAVALILMATIMDTADGRLARWLNCSSAFGAELDSLSDVVSFGVAPALIVYLWSLCNIQYKGIGWAIVLFYIACTALRLARFNVEATTNPDSSGEYFVGVPVPAAASMITLPLMISFEIYDMQPYTWFMAAYMLVVGLLMISRIKTISGKKFHIQESHIPILLIISALLVIGIIFSPWILIPAIIILYIITIPIMAIVHYRRN